MSLDDVKREFVEQVKLRAQDDQYIDTTEEGEILQLALQRGVTADSARAALAEVCESHGYVLERRVMADVKHLIQASACNDGKIDEKEFHDAVTTCKQKMQGKKNDTQIKRMIVELIEDNALPVKTGLFTNWYARVKKEVGIA
jgi:hypothetical protein